MTKRTFDKIAAGLSERAMRMFWTMICGTG